jgi:hypothetical protein
MMREFRVRVEEFGWSEKWGYPDVFLRASFGDDH